MLPTWRCMVVLMVLASTCAMGDRCRSHRPMHPTLPDASTFVEMDPSGRSFRPTAEDCGSLSPLSRAYCLNLRQDRHPHRRGLHPMSTPINNVTPQTINRSENNCTDRDGAVCEQCCNAECCEKVSDSAAPPQSTLTEASGGSTSALLVLPVAITLISPFTTTMGLSSSEIQEQFRVLNVAYASTRVRFVPHSYRHIKDDQYNSNCNTDPCYVDPTTCGFFNQVLPNIVVGDRSSTRVINVVVCSISYVGEAQLPWVPTDESSPVQYVQVQYNAWANKASSGTYFDGGKTLVHEMGHYLGLLHTFERENLCDLSGDYVPDTPNTRTPAAVNDACDAYSVSCSGHTDAGPDDRANYMNYARDSCMVSFTSGQLARMEAASLKYRPLLVESHLMHGSCPSMSNPSPNYNLDACVCEDATQSPLTLCGSYPNSNLSTAISLFLSGSSKADPDPPSPEQGGEEKVVSSSTLGLIIGISAAGGVALVAGVSVLIYCVCCQEKSEDRAARRQEEALERRKRIEQEKELARLRDANTRARIQGLGNRRVNVPPGTVRPPPSSAPPPPADVSHPSDHSLQVSDVGFSMAISPVVSPVSSQDSAPAFDSVRDTPRQTVSTDRDDAADYHQREVTLEEAAPALQCGSANGSDIELSEFSENAAGNDNDI